MSTPGIPRQGGTGCNDKTILPCEKVFPIQIGSELFKLSGASISSDAPSYFSQFFEEQLRQNDNGGSVRTLYIDRDPVTFKDILNHLQGYHVRPRDGTHFVKLFADAQFYSLPRLMSQLFELEIFIQIGDRHFEIPRDIFSGPGDSPNFFTLGFGAFFANPADVFPGLERDGLLRPPAIAPPIVINRSGEVFAELLHVLRGYPPQIRNEEHREELLRDCRYFHLRGLEQKLIAHHISYNLQRQKSEIVIRLEDVRQSGVQYVRDSSDHEGLVPGGWVHYARPFVDDNPHGLIIEIGGETTLLDRSSMTVDMHGVAKSRISSLFQVIANKMNLPSNAPLGLLMASGGTNSQAASPGRTPLSDDQIKVSITSDTDIVLDGERYFMETTAIDYMHPITPMFSGDKTILGGNKDQSDVADNGEPSRKAAASSGHPPAKRKRSDSTDREEKWAVRKGQWRLRVQEKPDNGLGGQMEIILVAVKLDAITDQRGRNAKRGFLSP